MNCVHSIGVESREGPAGCTARSPIVINRNAGLGPQFNNSTAASCSVQRPAPESEAVA